MPLENVIFLFSFDTIVIVLAKYTELLQDYFKKILGKQKRNKFTIHCNIHNYFNVDSIEEVHTGRQITLYLNTKICHSIGIKYQHAITKLI